jgi:hypothetical protein
MERISSFIFGISGINKDKVAEMRPLYLYMIRQKLNTEIQMKW